MMSFIVSAEIVGVGELRILGAWHDPRGVGIGHRGADDADLDALHEGLSRRTSLHPKSIARSPCRFRLERAADRD